MKCFLVAHKFPFRIYHASAGSLVNSPARMQRSGLKAILFVLRTGYLWPFSFLWSVLMNSAFALDTQNLNLLPLISTSELDVHGYKATINLDMNVYPNDGEKLECFSFL